MTVVLVSYSDSFNLDNSMFVVEGSWQEGYIYDKDIFFMSGVKDVICVGEFSIMRAQPRIVTDVEVAALQARHSCDLACDNNCEGECPYMLNVLYGDTDGDC